MKLVLAEKEDAGRKIAEALGIQNEHRATVKIASKTYTFTYWEGSSVVVVPAQGHLFTVWPKGITNARLEDLPILDWYWKSESSQAKARFILIKRLVDEYGIVPEDFVIGTDWDREGEVIGYSIFGHIFRDWSLPPTRMYFSSLMPSDVRTAFSNPKRMNERLLTQGLARNIADAIIGLNITKALTRRFKDIYSDLVQAMSLGRVQSPVLLYVVKALSQRIEEVREKKKEEDYTTVKVIVKITSKGKTYYYEPFFGFRNMEPPFRVSVKKERTVVQAPELLMNTDEIITKIEGLTPSKVMEIMERLYLKGWLTYPRTESKWVPLEFLREIINTLRSYLNIPQSFRAENSPSISEEYAHEGKTAIILTPDGIHAYFNNEMDELEKLVALRIIDSILRTVMPKLEAEVLKLVVEDSKGRREEIEWQTKPLFSETDVYTHISFTNRPDIDPNDIRIEILEFPEEKIHVTYKPIYTINTPTISEADIVRWMQFRDLGTDATRPNYPELLKQRRYVYDELYPTILGKKIADIVRDIGITAELTSEMEREIGYLSNLDDIERFKKEWVDRYTREFVEKIKELPDEKFYFRCPRCGAVLELRQYPKSKRIYGFCNQCNKRYQII